MGPFYHRQSDHDALSRRITPFVSRGFTLVELLVVLAIIVTITGIIFSSRSDFNNTIILSNTAYDVALTIRNTQNYGIGSRVIGEITNAGYGAHFERGVETNFVSFIDRYPAVPITDLDNCRYRETEQSAPNASPGNCFYEETYGADQTERWQTFVLGNAVTIPDFCVKKGTSAWSCSSELGGPAWLDITFARPNADMVITTDEGYDQDFPVTEACIFLASQGGGARYVSINQAGLIRPLTTPCLGL